MAKKTTFGNLKGGVMKTGLVHNTAYQLASRGLRVLALDLDPQANLTLSFGGSPIHLQQEERTIYWGVVKNKSLKDLIIPSSAGGPDLLPSSLIAVKVDRELMSQMRYSDLILREKLAELEDTYDHILIDTPPYPTLLSTGALTVSDYVVIPVKTEFLAIMGIPLIYDIIDEIKQRTNPKLKILGAVPTIYNGRLTQDREALTALRQLMADRGIPVFDPVPDRVAWKTAHLARPAIAIEPQPEGVAVIAALAEAIVAGSAHDNSAHSKEVSQAT